MELRDGDVRPIKGSLPIAIQAREAGFQGFDKIPLANVREAGLVKQSECLWNVNNIREVIDFFENGETGLDQIQVNTREEFFNSQYDFEIDFADVKGQKH